jgi:hypothetical protein
LRAHCIGECTVVADTLVDFLAVVEVVGERRMDVAECQVVLGRDLVDALAKSFVPDRDVLGP